MKTQSAKAKGRRLQQWVRDILRLYGKEVGLEDDDIKSTSMGASGEDVQLSPRARSYYPISIECKSRKAFAVYKDYDQAISNAGLNQPVLVIKADRRNALCVVDAEYFFQLLAGEYKQ